MTASGLLKALLDRRPALLRYLMLRGAAADEAEDVVQEVSLKLADAATGPVADPGAYLYRMANNQWLDQRRGEGRRQKREIAWIDAQGGTDRERDDRPAADVALAARQQVAVVQRALDALPDRTRHIFARFRIEGEGQRAIAADLGISVSAVEKHLARAYQAIAAARTILDGESLDPRRLGDDGDRRDA